MTAVVIGIDLGSSTIKVAAFTVDGRVVGQAERVFPAKLSANGAVEADSEIVFDLTLEALAELPASAKNASAIAVTGQIGGAIGIDADGLSVGKYESYLDERSTRQRDSRSEPQRAHQRSISGIEPYVMPRILRWFAEEPEQASRVAKVTMLPAWLGWRLAGLAPQASFIDRTSVGLFGGADVRQRKWDEDAVASWPIPRELLPEIVEPTRRLGPLDPHVASRTGLSSKIVVVAGLGDAAAGWLAAGAVSPGDAVNTAGTSEHFSIVTDDLWVDEAGVLASVPSAISGLYHAIGYTAGAGLSQRWFIRQVLKEPLETANFAALEAEVATIENEASNLIFIPHLGGRVCPTQPEVNGAWIGLNWSHGRGHLYRAVMESIPLEFTTYFTALAGQVAVKAIIGMGGATRSTIWNQIKADVCGVPYQSLTNPREASWGAALVAATGVGLIEDLATHSTAARGPVKTFEPRPERRSNYTQLTQIYSQSIETLRPTFAALRAIGAGACLPEASSQISRAER